MAAADAFRIYDLTGVAGRIGIGASSGNIVSSLGLFAAGVYRRCISASTAEQLQRHARFTFNTARAKSTAVHPSGGTARDYDGQVLPANHH
jgi:hypothetical protein